MTSAKLKLTREQLYEMVWTTPMKKFVEVYGVDGAVVGLCYTHTIPLPPPGYWAQLAMGHNPPRAPLPLIDSTKEIAISLPRVTETDVGSIREETPKVEVPTDLAEAHKVVLAMSKLLNRAPKDADGRLRIDGDQCSTLAVTSVLRAGVVSGLGSDWGPAV